MPIACVRGCGVNSHQHVAVTKRRQWHLFKVQHVGWSVRLSDDGFHSVTPTDVRFEASRDQEPGESACGSDVIRETPCRPPGGHAGVRDDVAVNGVLNAMASQRTNDDPCAPLESGNGRDHEQRHHG